MEIQQSMMRLAVILIGLAAFADTARILAFFPFVAKSHHFVFRPIIEELGRRGHEVVYFTGYEYDKPPLGIQQISILEDIPRSNQSFSWLELGEAIIPVNIITLYEIGLMFGHAVLKSAKVQQLIHSEEKFDAVIMESYFVQEYLSPFIHKFNAVGIEVMPLGDCAWVGELSALPDNPAYQIDYKMQHTNSLNFLDRLYNTYITASVTLGGYYYLNKMQDMVDKYFNYTGWESRPLLTQLVSNRSLILSNSHPAIGYPAPLAPHRREIGGINVKPNKPLPKDLQKFMDDSKNGVIYMSLGSNINLSDLASNDVRESFMSAFKDLPQNVLLKWENEYPEKLPANVEVRKWLPQQDILAHKNCAVFVTHGGYLSISEAVHFGVPLVGIPVFGDQAKNLILVEEAGYGRMIWYRNITKESVLWTLKEVLSNQRYKTEAMKRSKIVRDRRHSPAEEAAYWIEHAIKYPNSLTPKGATLTFVELHNLDVIVFLVVAVLLFIRLIRKSKGLFSIFKSKPKYNQEIKKKMN